MKSLEQNVWESFVFHWRWRSMLKAQIAATRNPPEWLATCNRLMIKSAERNIQWCRAQLNQMRP